MSRVSVKPVAFDRWPECCLLSNGVADLVIPRSFGPRIMSCGFTGARNLFKIFPDEGPAARIRGGHRLWVAPEREEVTWVNDNAPVEVEPLDDGARVTGAVEERTGLRKEMRIRLADREAAIDVVHCVLNTNPWAIEFAPWALTQMAPGGLAICGFPPRGRHPEALLPTHPLVMWAYTNLGDPRWRWGERYFTLRQDPEADAPQKIGLFHTRSWMAYLLDTELFVKESAADPARAYPDFGCSLEIFTNRFMLELETLGPLARVEPGGVVEHVERWSLHRDVRLAGLADRDLEAALRVAM